ncbi:MAG: Gfo/Idh/MocA family oxidoreductase [Pirellulaceae bacterium]|jgi:predicted dehydrogenase|nr:Gfo/Idh/MocA family oxidoreductase [Pirellulaceae bacterium]
MDTIRVGVIGLGANTRLRHVPGLRECDGVEITGVCNRSGESTERAAAEFGIPKRYHSWRELVDDDDIDAVVVGTWPYLHCEITCAALDAGKHVMTEARMARNVSEARQMLAASERYPNLVTQIVPSPLGLHAHQVVVEKLQEGFIGELREVVVLATSPALIDPAAPIHWRQDAELSGLNMLALGILHETLTRWTPQPCRVHAQTHTFVERRTDPATGEPRLVGTPDSVHVLTEIAGGGRGVYHLSGVMHHGPGPQIHIYGTAGTMRVAFGERDELWMGTSNQERLELVEIPAEKAGGWRVERDFVEAIRGERAIQFTDFASGVDYMQFTEAVARSAADGRAVELANV